MSLRYKALALVVVLVTAVTGGLLLFVKSRVEEKTEADIADEIAVDGLRLKERLQSAADIARAALRSALNYGQFREFESYPEGIQANYVPIAANWVTQSRADFSVAALDSLKAEEHRAKALHKGKEWWIVASGTGDAAAPPIMRFATSASVNALLGRTIGEVRTIVEVIPVDQSLFLAVSLPFFEDSTSFQRFCTIEDRLATLGSAERAAEQAKLRAEFPVYGVAITLTELSDGWARRNRLRKPAVDVAAHGTDDEARHRNEIFQVLYDGNRVTATSLPDVRPALEALGSARAGANERFRALLEVGGRRETYVGLALGFDDQPFSWNRPGFLTIKSLDPELAPLRSLVLEVTGVAALFAALGALAAYGASWLVIRRLRTLQVATEKVRAGNFLVTVPVDSRDEVGTLAVAFNNMIKGLQALGLYTDSVLARSVLDNPELLGNKAARHEGTVLFTDIRNFTGITETMDASELTTQLNEYFSAIGEHVKKEGGYLDKFIGDAVMAFWGAPFLATPDHAARACRAAMQCTRAAAELRRQWKEQGRPLFFQRIGVATGEVVVGNIGSATKKNFTVIGDSVNLANRLEGASKIYGTEILLDDRTVELAGSAILVREVDEILVRGKQKPVRVFELMGLAAETSTRALRLIEIYGQALKWYRAGDYAGAKTALAGLRKSDPEDGPSKWLSERCDEVLSGKAAPLPMQITKSYGPAKE
ncbi:MAG: adenylate [Planctomycetota bacterium]|nr:MAG: adenylate [Planctomycetota bacterium]